MLFGLWVPVGVEFGILPVLRAVGVLPGEPSFTCVNGPAMTCAVTEASAFVGDSQQLPDDE